MIGINYYRWFVPVFRISSVHLVCPHRSLIVCRYWNSNAVYSGIYIMGMTKQCCIYRYWHRWFTTIGIIYCQLASSAYSWGPVPDVFSRFIVGWPMEIVHRIIAILLRLTTATATTTMSIVYSLYLLGGTYKFVQSPSLSPPSPSPSPSLAITFTIPVVVVIKRNNNSCLL